MAWAAALRGACYARPAEADDCELLEFPAQAPVTTDSGGAVIFPAVEPAAADLGGLFAVCWATGFEQFGPSTRISAGLAS
jgi:hypothetical protein